MVLPLEMDWRHLLFENWPVDPELMDSHVPDGLSPDTYDGSAWLSVVPFTNVDVRTYSSRPKHPGARPAHYEASYWPTGEPFSAPEGSA
ncbi:hypothetical protein BRC96_03570 [Halobacteriales archaeon QS_6_64_34]|nr:MAG: hypothetical protein BRC96_03570 [Halobacteriales archaeon QS_6_64_34]